MQRVAVIQTAFPGDVILSTPMFEALKEKFPGCETVAVVRPESAGLLERDPNVDEIEVFDKYGVDKGITGIFGLAGRLRGCARAYIVQRHFRSALVALLAGIPVRVGFDNAQARWLYTKRVKYREDVHEVERCLSLLERIERRYSPKIHIDRETSRNIRELLRSEGIVGDYAVVAPGSVWPTKRYPYYPGLIHLIGEKLKLPAVLVGGRGDIPDAQSIVEACAVRPHNMVGKTDLVESAAVISGAKIVFANDSAPAHISAAVGTPVVAIFGPTVPRFGFAPYSENSAVADVGDLYCRPCTRHGGKRCPQRHFRCMLELSPARIIETAELLLRR